MLRGTRLYWALRVVAVRLASRSTSGDTGGSSGKKDYRERDHGSHNNGNSSGGQGSSSTANYVDPFRVLGVTSTTPFAEVRQRFHTLAQQYHPDMATGDPIKFREINAAYRQIRATYRTQKVDFTAGPGTRSTATPSGGAFWEERNEEVRKTKDRMDQQRRRAKKQEMDDQRMAEERRKSTVRRFLDSLGGADIFIACVVTVVAVVYGAERYYTANKMLRAKANFLRNIDEGLPPAMPLEVDADMVKKYSVKPNREELSEDQQRIKEESRYRKVTQRRFEDFREFMYVYDPDGVASRRVTTQRFSYQYTNEDEITARCPVVKNINSDIHLNGYESIEKYVTEEIQATPWVSPDMGYAGGLVSKGMSCIPMNSPSTAKWTFIEYTDVGKKTGKRGASEPVCLAAIRNHRFDKVGMCQRITITGREDLQPELLEQRKKDLQSGVLSKRKLRTGGPLPIKDLSVPLKDMKL